MSIVARSWPSIKEITIIDVIPIYLFKEFWSILLYTCILRYTAVLTFLLFSYNFKGEIDIVIVWSDTEKMQFVKIVFLSRNCCCPSKRPSTKRLSSFIIERWLRACGTLCPLHCASVPRLINSKKPWSSTFSPSYDLPSALMMLSFFWFF